MKLDPIDLFCSNDRMRGSGFCDAPKAARGARINQSSHRCCIIARDLQLSMPKVEFFSLIQQST